MTKLIEEDINTDPEIDEAINLHLLN